MLFHLLDDGVGTAPPRPDRCRSRSRRTWPARRKPAPIHPSPECHSPRCIALGVRSQCASWRLRLVPQPERWGLRCLPWPSEAQPVLSPFCRFPPRGTCLVKKVLGIDPGFPLSFQLPRQVSNFSAMLESVSIFWGHVEIHLCRVLKGGGAVGSVPNWRIGLLVGLGSGQDLVELKELTVIGDGVLGPRL